MRRDIVDIKKEAKSRGLGEIDKKDLIIFGIILVLEDLVEKKKV
jgi:hypothetical protein